MSCPYCENKTKSFLPINQTVEYSGIEIALNRQGLLRVRVLDCSGGEPTIRLVTQDVVELKNCPLCGKRFVKEPLWQTGE